MFWQIGDADLGLRYAVQGSGGAAGPFPGQRPTGFD